MKKVYILLLLNLPLFSFKTHLLSETLWDRIMEEQSYLNLTRGISHLLESNYTKAAEEFLKSLEKRESSLGYALYGASLYWMGDNEGASQNYKKALELDPKNDIAWQLEGIAYAREGRLNEALESFLKAYSINPTRSDTLMNISSVYFSLGNLSNAVNYIKKAINLDPLNPLYHHQLGLIKLYEERLEEAQESFQKAIKIKPDYQEAILWNGITLELLGEIKDAIKNYEKAITLKKQDYFARYKLARAYLKDKRILKKEILYDCFKLELPKNNQLPLQLTYAVKEKDTKQQASQMIDDIINNADEGDELHISIHAIYEKHDFTFDKKSHSEDITLLQKALSKRFERKITTISKNFVIKVERDNPFYKQELERIKDHLVEISKDATRINISASIKKASKTDKPSDTQAVYIPRNIGNDMGLWLIGNPWVYILEEEIRSSEIKTKEYKIIAALGYLLLGDTLNSKKLFDKIKDTYPDIAYLGLGVANYLDGEKELAKNYFSQAMKYPTSQKIAIINLRYINGDK